MVRVLWCLPLLLFLACSPAEEVNGPVSLNQVALAENAALASLPLSAEFFLKEWHFNPLGLAIYNAVELWVAIDSSKALHAVNMQLSRDQQQISAGTLTIGKGLGHYRLAKLDQPGYAKYELTLLASRKRHTSTESIFLSSNSTKALILKTQPGLSDVRAEASLPDLDMKDDQLLASDLVLEPGYYRVADSNKNGVFRPRKSGLLIDCQGSIIEGDGTGYGIVADRIDSLVIRNCTFRNFYQAVSLSHSAYHLIYDSNFSENYIRPSDHTVADFLRVNDCPPSERNAGGGIRFDRVNHSAVINVQATHQQNGLLLLHSSDNLIEQNTLGTNEGWGIFMCQATHNEILRNSINDNYNRVSSYCHDVQQDGCDTAAIVMMKGTSYNTIVDNDIRNSGDGIFLAGLSEPGPGGADFNYFAGNDASFSKHLGFESTFSEGNVFENNKVIGAGRACFWLGYSTQNEVRGNYIADCGWEGINVDHGVDILVEGNFIANTGREAISIWRTKTENDPYPAPEGYQFIGNHIRARRGIAMTDASRSSIADNCIEARTPTILTNSQVAVGENSAGPCSIPAEEDFPFRTTP